MEMKRTALAILKIGLAAAALLLVLFLVVAATLFFDWPLWVAIFLLLGLLGVGLAGLLARKLWLKRREQRFVTRMIEQDEARVRQLADQERQQSQELQQRWHEAIDALRHSHLKRQGNPLYVLPWYMIIGESGSGKTTALQSAQLSSPFAEVRRTSGISGTRNCDWWFYEQAIFIDTAGRYAIPVDEGADREEWQKFLTLLSRYRKKEPLNGLVVTVAADKLIEAPADTLESDGKSIRRRMDELMRLLGAKFPVYLLVTKCDLIQGMSRFCEQLPAQSLSQAMGVVNRSLTSQVAEFLDRAVRTIGDRLRDYRLLLFHRAGETAAAAGVRHGPDPALLLFPEEFERLRAGLEKFIGGAFQPNPYQETPLLRGLFFSSGRQEGRPYSHFLKELGLISEREMLPGTSRGLFLNEFFTKILPADRRLFMPTQHALSWSRLTRSLGLTGWLAVGIAACGLLSFSFVKNLQTLNAVSRTVQVESLTGDLLADTQLMADFHKRLEGLRQQGRSWWISHFGLRHNERVEAALRQRFVQRFQTGLLERIDQQMTAAIEQFSTATPGPLVGDHAAHLAGRILMLQARLREEGVDALQKMRLPVAPPIQAQVDRVMLPGVEQGFHQLHAVHLAWSTDRDQLNRSLREHQKLLNRLLTDRRTDLNWLVEWIDQRAQLPAVGLAEFWPELAAGPGAATVAPAFGRLGKEAIDRFLLDLHTALGEEFAPKTERSVQAFQVWYRQAGLRAWSEFGEAFAKVPGQLKGPEVFQRAASRMGSDQNPYFLLLERMAAELRPFAEAADLPPWAQRLFEFTAARQAAALLDTAGTAPAGVLQKAAEELKAKAAQLEKGKEARPDALAAGKARLAEAQHFKDYQKHLAAAAGAAVSREAAYQAAAVMYREDPATSQSPFHQAVRSANAFRAAMPAMKLEPKVFWDLALGPLEFLKIHISEEAGCQLQALWEKDVLLPARGISDRNELAQVLLEPQGPVAKFMSGPAAPFVDQSISRGGYHPKRVQGVSLTFAPDFFTFLNRGARAPRPSRESYMVSLEAKPTHANPEARIQPAATRLEVKCADKRYVLVNRNFPVMQVFNWSAQTCGDVLFQIEVGNLLLTREYGGPQGFPRFLQEFQRGERIFTPKDFPGEGNALQSLGINTITVRYAISGHEPVIQLLSAAPARVPTQIVQCIDR